MKFLIGAVIFTLCSQFTFSERGTYKAGFVSQPVKLVDLDSYSSLIRDAAKSNVDILVFPSPETASDSTLTAYNYDEIIKSISTAAKREGLYVVANVYEKARCQDKMETIRSNLVFDRDGAIISVYSKPISNVANCTSSAPSTFTTDFGVTFGLLMEEDMVLQSIEGLKKLKNFVVTGAWASEIPFLSASQFSPSWAYVMDANLVTPRGIFSGRAGATGAGSAVVVAELDKDVGSGKQPAPVLYPTKRSSFPGEDLSQYIIRPVDLAASERGYSETVCHGKFCCEFYVKTSGGSRAQGTSYGMGVFAGTRRYFNAVRVGAQKCSLLACAGLYKRTCALGSNNSTNIHFEMVTIKGNFTQGNSAQFPIVASTSESPINLKFNSLNSQVVIEVTDSQNLLSLGILGRDYSKDFEAESVKKDTEGVTLDIYEYLNDDDFVEFFDYVWIRLRILFVVVSIYFLEMM